MKKNYLLALLPTIFYINSVSAENIKIIKNSVSVEKENYKQTDDTGVYDMNGNSIEIDSTSFIKDDVTGKIYSQDGRVFIHKGTYEYWDNYGNTIVKDCSKALLFTDPYVEPDAGMGELPGPECYFQQIEYHQDGSEYKTIKKKVTKLKNKTIYPKKETSSYKAYNCSSFYGYAPPIAWSKPILITSHVGPTSYNITVAPKGDTEIFSWVKFHGKKKWIHYKFRKSANFKTGNFAAPIEISFNGIPFGSVVTGNIC